MKTNLLILILLGGLIPGTAPPAMAVPKSLPMAIGPVSDVRATQEAPDSLAAPLALVGVSVFICFLLACDFQRLLKCEPSNSWQLPEYGRQLPNVLNALARTHFSTPWPMCCAFCSRYRYKRRLLHTIRPVLKEHTESFLKQHLSLWWWLQVHRAPLGSLLHQRQRQSAHDRLLSETSPQQRRALLAFLNNDADSIAHQKPAEESALGRYAVARLDQLASIFREHGYHLSPDFALMEQLEHDCEYNPLAQSKPVLA